MKISKFFDNIGIKLICLLLAVVVWLYANKGLQIPKRGGRGQITFREVPIQLTPGGRGKPDPENISLEVECSTTEVNAGNLRVVVATTLEDWKKKRVVLTPENVELPEGMDFVKAEPNEIGLTD